MYVQPSHSLTPSEAMGRSHLNELPTRSFLPASNTLGPKRTSPSQGLTFAPPHPSKGQHLTIPTTVLPVSPTRPLRLPESDGSRPHTQGAPPSEPGQPETRAMATWPRRPAPSILHGEDRPHHPLPRPVANETPHAPHGAGRDTHQYAHRAAASPGAVAEHPVDGLEEARHVVWGVVEVGRYP